MRTIKRPSFKENDRRKLVVFGCLVLALLLLGLFLLVGIFSGLALIAQNPACSIL